MDIIDRKFKIMAVNPCKMHTLYTEKNSVLLCAHDEAVPAALEAYQAKCKELGCDDEHIESIELLIKRVIKYQEKHHKIPDTDGGCELDRCIGGLNLDG